jgi:hypothetical protein
VLVKVAVELLLEVAVVVLSVLLTVALVVLLAVLVAIPRQTKLYPVLPIVAGPADSEKSMLFEDGS